MATVPVQPGLFTIDDDRALTLVGARCASCGRSMFPASDSCPWCRATDVHTVELPRRGSLWGWTTVATAPPGYDGPVPYGFGVVELGDVGLRVVTRLTVDDPAALVFGQAMHAVADVVGTDAAGNDVVSWAFAPADAP